MQNSSLIYQLKTSQSNYQIYSCSWSSTENSGQKKGCFLSPALSVRVELESVLKLHSLNCYVFFLTHVFANGLRSPVMQLVIPFRVKPILELRHIRVSN